MPPSPPRVLVVEDDPLIALDLAGIVARALGAAPDLATTVEEALARAARPLDLALLDVDVTDGKTFPLAERLAAQGTPFAFVSGSGREALPAALRGAPFLAKPYRAREVEATLLALAGGRAA